MFRSPKEHTPDFYKPIVICTFFHSISHYPLNWLYYISKQITNNGRMLYDYSLQQYDEMNNTAISKFTMNKTKSSFASLWKANLLKKHKAANAPAFHSTSNRF